ncbi:MAG: PIG-L deacetylase family protein [Acidimicrobiia bacterium]
MTTLDLTPPGRALAIGAHPDDIEFGCGATLAKWAGGGTVVTLCICTDGAKGTWDPDADVAALRQIREQELRAAAAVLGAHAVEFLRLVDGELDHGLDARAAVCAVIRSVRPDVVLAHDPWPIHRIHPDHRHAGLLAIEGIVAARDPHFFPEQGRAPHRPRACLLFESEAADHVERVDGWLDRKTDALLRHRSQWRSTMHIDERPEEQQAAFVRALHDAAQTAGLRAGVRAGEAFRRIDEL